MSSCWLGDKIQYSSLSGKEKESYNTAKLRSAMADWGYLEAFTVNGDKHGADLLFYRSNDGNVMKVQLKGRPTLSKSYRGKGIFVAFQDKSTGQWYMYDHDKILGTALDLGKLKGTVSWEKAGSWSWSSTPDWLHTVLKDWEV